MDSQSRPFGRLIKARVSRQREYLADAFTLDACFWASDWPFLKAPQRMDMGVLMRQVERLLPDPAERARLWWETPRRWLGF